MHFLSGHIPKKNFALKTCIWCKMNFYISFLLEQFFSSYFMFLFIITLVTDETFFLNDGIYFPISKQSQYKTLKILVKNFMRKSVFSCHKTVTYKHNHWRNLFHSTLIFVKGSVEGTSNIPRNCGKKIKKPSWQCCIFWINWQLHAKNKPRETQGIWNDIS